MSKRLSTEEELLLWHQSNRWTRLLSTAEGGVGADAPANSSRVASHGEPEGRGVGSPSPLDNRVGASRAAAHASGGVGADAPANNSRVGASRAAPANKTPLDQRTAKKRKKIAPLAGTLDLHGCNRLDAHDRVLHFLQRQHARGHRHVAIITGKGRAPSEGILRRELPLWLNDAPLRELVSGFFHAAPNEGGEGVLHILLKPKRD